jgi:sugar diacid utilization regulator
MRGSEEAGAVTGAGTGAQTGAGTGAAEDGVVLARLVEALGPAVLRVLATPGLEGVLARDVVVFDPVDPPVLRRGDLLLCVGVVASGTGVCAVVEAAARAGAAAVVVRSRDADLPLLREAAERVGLTVVVLPAAMRWEQVAVLMRTAIASGRSGPGSLTAVGDLFGFANVLARAVGGAVTIEDAGSHVLAYSTLHDDELDAPRREAILGRQVPATYLEHLRDRGIFDALARSDDVVRLEADEGLGLRRRLVVAVRAGAEQLGTLWALEGRLPLGPEAEQVLRDAAEVAATHLVRAQSSGSTLQQHREDLLRHLLEDATDVRMAADALGFNPDLPAAVIGIVLDSRGAMPADQHAYRRLDEMVRARAMAFRWHVACTLSGVRMLALLPELTGERTQVEPGIRRLAAGFAADAEQAGLRVRVACGPVAASLADAARATAVVDQVLLCLGREPARGPVATYDEVRAAVSVGKAVAALAPLQDLWEGPVRVLVEHDAVHGTAYRHTLRAWLDALGDTATAATALRIHPNTVRYRMARITELSGIRLDDPEERLVADLHLRRL